MLNVQNHLLRTSTLNVVHHPYPTAAIKLVLHLSHNYTTYRNKVQNLPLYSTPYIPRDRSQHFLPMYLPTCLASTQLDSTQLNLIWGFGCKERSPFCRWEKKKKRKRVHQIKSSKGGMWGAFFAFDAVKIR